MDQSDDLEDISSFLNRLRLPEEYVHLFHQHGRFVVKDCVDLNNVALQEIGISLPGHIRRILNKLPMITDLGKNVDIIYDTPSARNIKVDVVEENLENQLSSGSDAHHSSSRPNEVTMVHGSDELITEYNEYGRQSSCYHEESIYEFSTKYLPSPTYDVPSSTFHSELSRVQGTTFTNYETPGNFREDANPSCKPEDDYGRLQEDTSSPIHLRSSAASIPGSNGQHKIEGEYDTLDNVLPPSPRFDDPEPFQHIPTAYSDDMKFETEKHDFELESSTTFGNYSHSSASPRSITPLPPVHLPEHVSAFSESHQVPSKGEYLSCQRSESQEDERNAFSDYNVLSLIPTPYSRKESSDMNTDSDVNDVAEDSEYDTVEYRPTRGKTDELPPAPHNTPDHILDTPVTEESSYEEVTFPFDRKSSQQVSPPRDDSIYSGIDENVEDHKVVPSKNTKTIGGRRSTGLHALQKAAETAKAAVTKRRANRKLKAENQAVSFSDNESDVAGKTGDNSVTPTTASLNDLEITPKVPPTGNMYHLQLKESSSPPRSLPPRRYTGLSRLSPVTRRRRFDGQTRTETDRMTSADGIYEDVDDLNLNSGLPSDALTSRNRPVLPQRPVSVFMEPSGYPDDIRGSTSDRDRVHSATLKPGIVPPEDMEYMDVNEFLRSYQHSTPIIPVSPLAKKRTKSGWLWKHSGPEGRSPFRKRWAVFDGEELSYYESDTKTDISKGILPVEVMLRLQMPPNSQTIFHLQMKGGRTLIFQAENGNERAMWASTLMAAMLENQQKGASQHKPGGDMSMPYKEGLLKMEGQKIYMAIKGDQAVYYKSKNEFLFAQPIARLPMNLATVKDIANRKFQVVLPYRTFTFSVESEEEKRLWTTSFKDAISEGLSDYQVLNEIWANEANTKCADCGRDYPDWASVNLAIVICKHCAGVHREIGVHNSKVRSLKMDVKIWDPIMKRLLIDIGNGNANRFWSCNLNSADEITDMADKKQRSWFIKAKYIDMGYARDRPEGVNQDLLNESLIEAVRTNNLIEAYHLVFSGADINCYTGKEHAKTPHSLAEHLSYATLAELLRQNGGTEIISPKGHITDRNTSVRKKTSIPKTRSRPPICIRDCLFKFGGDFKSTGEDTKAKGKFNLIMSALQPGDFQKRLCVLENSYLKYCDPEKPNTIKDSLSCNDLISISVYTPEQALKAGYKHCFELSRNSGRTYLFCADHEDTRKRWTQGLFQEVVPVYVQDAVQGEKEYDRVGKVNIKAKKWSKSDTQWSSTWCLLQGKNLHYYHREYTSMETIDLRKLVQITFDHTKETVSTQSNSTAEKESIPIIMLVFREKSYYIRSETKPDTDSWMAALKRADNTSGPTLEDKQLTTEGTPVVLEKCLTYVEQFGIATRGIYRLSGTHSKTSQLLTEFRQNARETQMREGQLNVHDVANALKRWFKSLPGSLLTEPLYDNWIETAQIRQEHYDRKLEWYKHLIDKLPEINKVTLKVLLNHLKKVSSHEKENEMSVHNLAIVFGPTLMQPQADGDSNPQYLSHTSEQIACIEDLLRCYDWLFDVTEIDREKELRMQQAKEKINQAKQQQNMLTTMDYDMMVPVYINKREDRCTNQKVNLKAGELIVKICKAHGYPPEKWGLFEGILDGDAERALHYSEHVLSVIKSWDMPSTNYLVAKNDYIRDKMKWFRQAATSIGETLMEGPLRFYEGKKKWSKVTGHVGKNPQDGIVYFKIVKVQAKTLLSLGVSSFNIYVGVDKKTKPPGSWKQGFTIKQVGETPKYFVAETEGELFRWISHILLSAHPEGFTPPASLESSPSKAQDDVSPYAAISQQELQQAATKVFRKQRTVTGDATEFEHAQYADENFNVDYDPALQTTGISSTGKHDSPGMDYGDASYAYDGTNAARHAVAPIPARRPNHINTGYSRQPPLPNALSPVGGPNSIGLGMQLKDELSGVLRKRTQ